MHIPDIEMLAFSSHRVSATEENVVIKKTHCNFSAIPIDQAHEQSNKTLKGEGRVIGLTKRPLTIVALDGFKVVQMIKCTCTVFIDNIRNISTNSLI